jgi:hypothetical protein
MEWCKTHIHERAAIPKHLEILPNCPRPPWARCSSPTCANGDQRVYNAALAEAGVAARVVSVREDKKLGLVAHLELRAARQRQHAGARP